MPAMIPSWPLPGLNLRFLVAVAGFAVFSGPVLNGQPKEEFLGLPSGSISKEDIDQEDPTRKFAGLSREERKGLQEMILVERFLSLPPERLSEVRNSIELIQKMSPEEKERIKQQIGKFKRMPHVERKKMHDRWSAVSEERRTKMRNHWLNMSEEDRRAEREKLRTMTHEERRWYFRETFGAPEEMPPPPPPSAPPPLYSLSESEPLSTIGGSNDAEFADEENLKSSVAPIEEENKATEEER